MWYVSVKIHFQLLISSKSHIHKAIIFNAVFDCGRSDIPDPENGRVMADQTILRSVATFSCNANFVLVGDATRTCESTGWSGNNPSCGKSKIYTDVECIIFI